MALNGVAEHILKTPLNGIDDLNSWLVSGGKENDETDIGITPNEFVNILNQTSENLTNPKKIPKNLNEVFFEDNIKEVENANAICVLLSDEDLIKVKKSLGHGKGSSFLDLLLCHYECLKFTGYWESEENRKNEEKEYEENIKNEKLLSFQTIHESKNKNYSAIENIGTYCHSTYSKKIGQQKCIDLFLMFYKKSKITMGKPYANKWYSDKYKVSLSRVGEVARSGAAYLHLYAEVNNEELIELSRMFALFEENKDSDLYTKWLTDKYKGGQNEE